MHLRSTGPSTVTSCLRVIEIIQALSVTHYYDCLAGPMSLPPLSTETMDAQTENNAATYETICSKSVASLISSPSPRCIFR